MMSVTLSVLLAFNVHTDLHCADYFQRTATLPTAMSDKTSLGLSGEVPAQVGLPVQKA